MTVQTDFIPTFLRKNDFPILAYNLKIFTIKT